MIEWLSGVAFGACVLLTIQNWPNDWKLARYRNKPTLSIRTIYPTSSFEISFVGEYVYLRQALGVDGDVIVNSHLSEAQAEDFSKNICWTLDALRAAKSKLDAVDHRELTHIPLG